MRVPGTRVYRAFRELDRFDDAHCARFVHEAAGGFVRTMVRRTLLGLFGVSLTLLCTAFAGRLAWWAVVDSRSSDLKPWFGIAVAMLLIPLGPLSVVWVRDYWLRRRIWQVLRTQGRCSGCRYQLAGLSCTNGAVTCPECGLSIELSKAMLTLAGAGGGAGGDLRAVNIAELSLALAMDLPEPYWTRERLWRFAKRAGWSACAVVLVVVVALCVNEGVVRRDAAVAARDRVQLQNRIKPPEISPGAVDVNPIFARLGDRVSRALDNGTAKVRAMFPGNTGYSFGGMESYVDPDRRLRISVRRELPIQVDTVPTKQLIDAMVTREAVLECEEAGVFDELEALGPTWRSDTRTIQLANCFSVFPYAAWVGKDFNFVAGALNARLVMKADAGDWDGYAKTLRAFQKVTTAAWSAATAADCNALTLIESRVMLDLCRRVSSAGTDSAMLDAVEPALDAMGPSIDIRGWVRIERAELLEMTAFLFSEPDRVRWGLWSRGEAQNVRSITRAYEMPWLARMGTYGANVRVIEGVFGPMAADGSATPVQRSDMAIGGSTFLAPGAQTYAAQWRLMAVKQVECLRRAARVQAALLRHRLQTGVPASSLNDVRGVVGKGWLEDPFSSSEFGFVPVTDQGAGVLISTGPDRVSDYGRAHQWVRVDQAHLYMYGTLDQGRDFRFDAEEP